MAAAPASAQARASSGRVNPQILIWGGEAAAVREVRDRAVSVAVAAAGDILAGQMSIVGPRPEVRKYVDLYNEDQLKVLDVRPGLTDYASLEYINESEILSQHVDPEKAYIEIIMPAKLELNLKYIRERSMGKDVRIILQTLGGMFK